MGRHADAGRSRGIARWVITAVVVVIALAGITVGYLVIVNRSDSANDSGCTGSVTLPVAAGPGAAPALATAATAYNATHPVARSTCVTATVTSVRDGVALSGLTGRWPSGAGHAPGLWVPDSSAYLTALDATRPDLAAGHPSDPIAWSPLVLAVRAADVPAVADLSWSNLPAAAGPDGSAALPGGRHLLLALPPVDGNRATGYALQSMLAGGRTTALGKSAVLAGADEVRAVGRGAAGSARSTAAALTALAGGHDAVTAVPVVEADLVAFDAAGANLAAVHPTGPTAGDALIAAPITATWTDQTMAAAASSFQAYLTTGHGQQILADRGWRGTSAHPADPVPGVDTTAAVTSLPAGGPAVDDALATALGQPGPPSAVTTSATGAHASSGIATSTPVAASSTSSGTTVGSATASSTPPPTTSSTRTKATPSTSANPAAHGPVLTVVVDSSSGMAASDHGTSLLAWVKKALPAVTGGSVTDRVGLWAFADSGSLPPDGYPQLVSTGPLNDKVGTKTRSAALASAISGLRADGDRWAYGALMEALKEAPGAAVAGRTSRVVLITSGVDQTPATPRQAVLDAVRAARGKIRVDVVGLGSSVPADAYQAIAAAGGGQYIPVTNPAKLGQTLTDLLTLSH